MANSAFHPSGVGKWVPASAGKAKAGMVHSVSGCARGVQIKLWDPLRTCAIIERLRNVIMTRRYTNPRLPLPLPCSVRCPNVDGSLLIDWCRTNKFMIYRWYSTNLLDKFLTVGVFHLVMLFSQSKMMLSRAALFVHRSPCISLTHVFLWLTRWLLCSSKYDN